MKSIADGPNWLLRLNKDERLIKALSQFVREQGIKAAWLNGLGGALWAELGFYDLPAKQYHWQKLDQLLEITSLEGNVAWSNEEPTLHLHGTFANAKLQAFGGHIKELAVAGTCEIFLQSLPQTALTRSTDDAVGLNLLNL